VKIAVIAPVYNEAPWIGYSIMAAHPFVEEFVYAVSPKSDDGTIEILRHIAKNYGNVRILLQSKYDFDPMDMKAYNTAFNDCIDQTRCDAVWFLHPDMIVTQGSELKEGALAWWTNIRSYAGDFNTQITKGRASRWKNIHAKKFGLHYFGGYGSINEDFYHSDITGKSYRHYGEEFSKYPFEVANSGFEINHYCELKGYKRRLEKMKLCLRTQHPDFEQDHIDELASMHPRVTLDPGVEKFGRFEFTEVSDSVPEVITKYKDIFESLMKEPVHV
jgi:glycosyltransferase involved in cell wall biosynthesis